ncbi:hypothetical protein AXG93_1487s1080 [Marchantia polymorpha subsp. ruderalis]|uniref:CDP-diacylglycerol--serine O-phosphatidyltransferase n=1 Tax=Marchantia polymorpha subsp. ruderalis TaxID=1480154 RepID=A0A176WQH9_MARPO|nr:hypothetical protein AXG93_1487s1080 [Marchantia polymorpha subsp. ruderalis]
MGQLAGVSNAERDESEEIVVEDHDDEGMLKKLLKDLDPWTAWAYTPHTITVLILGACFLVWASGALRPEEQGRDHDVNTKAGVWAMVAVFLGYFSLQAPPTILIRPHPAFWRLVHGLAVLYLLFLTFLLFQTRDDARQFMKYLHPDLGVELGERSYGADCRIYTPENPHSIWAGLSTVRYFEGKTYEWVGLSQQPSLIGKVRRSLGQFTPAYWDKDQWNFLSGPIRFVQVMGLVIVILIVEVNAFYLKFILWIPPRNPLNSYRLLVWWIIANPAIREYNSFLQNNKPIKKLGAFCWLAVAIVILEVLICVKFGRGLFPKPMPTWIFWFWVTAGIVSLLTLIGWSIKLARDPKPVLIRNQSRDSKKIQ